MTRSSLLAGGPAAVGVRAVLRLLIVGRGVRAWMAHGILVEPGGRTAFVAVEATVHHHHLEAGFLDAAAGGEFVDDRIRLRE